MRTISVESSSVKSSSVKNSLMGKLLFLECQHVVSLCLSMICCAMLCLTTTDCSRAKEEKVRFAPLENLPEITALAWLNEGDAAPMTRFTSVSADGFLRVWDIFTGLVSVSENPAMNQTEDPSVFLADGYRSASSVISPGGSLSLAPTGDGAVSLMEVLSGKELARYYSFPGAEWICLLSEGIYNASFRGALFLTAETGTPQSGSYRFYRMDQLSGALYRPDLFAEILSGETSRPAAGAKESAAKISAVPIRITDLFREEEGPPRVSLSPGSPDSGELKGVLEITATAGKGGAGRLAFYRRADGIDKPVGFHETEKAADEKYSEKNGVRYVIRIGEGYGITFPEGELGVSAFNKNNTIESERLWITIPPLVETLAASRLASPRVFIASADEVIPGGAVTYGADTKAKISDGDYNLSPAANLFGNAETVFLLGNDFTPDEFGRALNEFGRESGEASAIVLYIKSSAYADSMGNLRLVPGQTGRGLGAELLWDDLAEQVLALPLDSLLLLFDLDSGNAPSKIETALLRLRQRLGPLAMYASIGGQGNESTLFGLLAEAFSGERPGSDSSSSGSRYISAAELINNALSADASGRRGIAFFPLNDFNIIDRFFNAGELKFQTMTSGMLKIDRVDQNPIPLIFGDTMTRYLPEGNYIIDMIYRNGYRETKNVHLAGKGSAWVIFTYTPPLLVGDFSSALPSLGINLSELNPANYEKVNREAMEGMGMAPYYVAFLAGEKLYREGDFGKAVTEYTRSISLKGDYAEAYASRGNARRKSGDYARAIDDYSRALSLQGGYAEVYNYRGFLYAQRGDLKRAIDDYTQAIRYKAGYTDAYFNRAYAHARQENWDGAIADYTQVIKAEPSNAVAYNERGKAWSSKGDKAKADADYAAAAKLK